MNSDREYFIDLAQKAKNLNAESTPLWGSMSAQHMIEHVVGSWRISNGRAKAPLLISEEESSKRKSILESDTPYPKNLKNPMFANGLPPLRKPSIEVAIEQLEDEMKTFFMYFEANPEAVEMHPIYGSLDYNGWMHFQKKHMGHHWSQFSL